MIAVFFRTCRRDRGGGARRSYLAQQVALFGIVMGVALLLTGIGFLVLTLGVLRGARPGRSDGRPTAPATA